ncbi:MAG: hypothetical protein KDF59_01615 [Nitrosomonas sp.]|nr:hypothetical protein [Nitrosomonas sp.]
MAPVALILLLLFVPVVGHTATYEASDYRSFIRDSAGNWKMVNSSNGNMTITSGNGGNTVHSNGNASLPTTKGSKLANLSWSAFTNLAKAGSALASFAKKLSPAGLAVGTALYICEQTGICDVDGQWTIPAEYDPLEYPSTVGYFKYCTGFGCVVNGTNVDGPSPVTTCKSTASALSEFTYGSTPSNIQCRFVRVSDGSDYLININEFANQCPTNYTLVNGQCNFNGSNQSRTPTDADWDQAANDLNQPGTTDHLINNGQDVPIIDPGVQLPTLDNSPIQLPIGSETTNVTDDQGNNIGSQTKETTLNIDDAATAENPNLIDLTETTTTINYDINNNIIDQSTTVTETSQPAPDPQTNDYTVEFDTVTDTPLQEKIVEAPLNTTSWGGGTCPPDIDLVLSVGNFVFESQPFCDFAIALNPLILLVASIIGAYIVITSGRPQTA